MEMNQFHPTCLYNLEVKNFLITEAMRGEGGLLKLPPGVPGGGKRFLDRHANPGGLVPRDVVDRAIDRKHAVKGKGMSVRVDCGGRRIIKKKTHKLEDIRLIVYSVTQNAHM